MVVPGQLGRRRLPHFPYQLHVLYGHGHVASRASRRKPGAQRDAEQRRHHQSPEALRVLQQERVKGEARGAGARCGRRGAGGAGPRRSLPVSLWQGRCRSEELHQVPGRGAFIAPPRGHGSAIWLSLSVAPAYLTFTAAVTLGSTPRPAPRAGVALYGSVRGR